MYNYVFGNKRKDELRSQLRFESEHKDTIRNIRMCD